MGPMTCEDTKCDTNGEKYLGASNRPDFALILENRKIPDTDVPVLSTRLQVSIGARKIDLRQSKALYDLRFDSIATSR
jgi:hypothetical protein